MGILLAQPLSNDPRFVQFIYRNSYALKRLVEKYNYECFLLTGQYQIRLCNYDLFNTMVHIGHFCLIINFY